MSTVPLRVYWVCVHRLARAPVLPVAVMSASSLLL